MIHNSKNRRNSGRVREAQSSDSNLSESSPLNEPGLVKARRRSTAEKLAAGIQKAIAAFEFEVVQSSRSSEELSDSESNFEDDFGVQQARSQGCRFVLTFLCLGACLVLSFALGYSAQKFAAVECSSKEDPIMALKDHSFIDNLENGAVAADHEVCSKVGKQILVEGGNAVDAGVATVLCLGVANPASSGLGGGAFILVHSDRANHEERASSMTFPEHHDKRDPDFAVDSGDKITEVIDCREVAPGSASEDMYLSAPESAASAGGLSIAVPGELRGLELAHARHGKLPWADVLAPAIKLAGDGVPVSKHLAHDIIYMGDSRTKDGDFAKLRRYLTINDDWESPRKEGELLKNKKLAETLQLVAEQGSNALYEGRIARDLVEDVAEEGGLLTEEDLSGYHATLRTPVFSEAFGYNLVGVPPPSSGGATIFGALRFLSGYDSTLASDSGTLSVHRMAEAMRHAFAIRMSMCDPAFFSNITNLAVQDLVSGSYMETLRVNTLDNDTLPLSMYGGKRWAKLHDEDGQKEAEDAHEGDRRLRQGRRLARPFGYLDDFGTSHLSVVDGDGNAVSITSSVNQIFGSAVFSDKTGVLLGDTMDDFGNPGQANFFGLTPSPENFIAPGKKPLSSMSPTMVFRKTQGRNKFALGKLALVVGGSGGPKIISAVLQVIINHLLLGMSLFESIARPRVHDQLVYHESAVTTTENSILLGNEQPIEVPQRTKDALLRRGRDSLLDIDYAGTVQAVSVDQETNKLSAASDIRKGGSPAGY